MGSKVLTDSQKNELSPLLDRKVAGAYKESFQAELFRVEKEETRSVAEGLRAKHAKGEQGFPAAGVSLRFDLR